MQLELEGTSTEPCFAEQIAIGLLQQGGVPEFNMAVGGRLLALEWDIDADGANALLELLGATPDVARSLGDGLFGLRRTLGPTARRITYRFTKDGRITC